MYGFVLSLCALASAQLSTTSQPVSVAICVTGQIRTFTDARVRESQWRLLVGELRRQASVLDVFLVVSGQPHVVTEDVRRWFHEVYGQSTVNVTSAVSSKMSQFLMWSICGEQMRKTGRHYDWSVRSRFDMFFYGPFPRLASLPQSAIYGQMRCWTYFSEFVEDMMPPQTRAAMWKKKAASTCSDDCHVDCLQPGCKSQAEARLDDAVTIIPWTFHDAYYGTGVMQCSDREPLHLNSSTDGVRRTVHNTGASGCITHSILRHSPQVDFRPIPLYTSISRFTGPEALHKQRKATPLGDGLELDAPYLNNTGGTRNPVLHARTMALFCNLVWT